MGIKLVFTISSIPSREGPRFYNVRPNAKLEVEFAGVSIQNSTKNINKETIECLAFKCEYWPLL